MSVLVSLFVACYVLSTSNSNLAFQLCIQCKTQTNDKSLRTPACERQNSSFRSTFTIKPGKWKTVRIPWSEFRGHGPGADGTVFEPMLRRLGVVSIGEAKDVVLAVSKVGFYNVF